MSGRRWMKFWPQDWQRDPALRSCSLAARGLWMEMLCVAHEGAPYGHVTINSKAMTSRQIASVAGVTEREAMRLIGELEDAGVFSRTADGVIYSRRMVRDAAATEAGREAIEKRWGKDDKPNSGNGRYPNRDPNRGGDSLEAEAEAEARKKGGEKPARKRATPLPENWQPSQDGKALAESLGLDLPAVLTKFRDHFRASGARLVDWDARWRLWCREDAGKHTPTATPVGRVADMSDAEMLAMAKGDGTRKPSLIRTLLADRPGALRLYEAEQAAA